jgi:hypothetical protein
MSSNQSASRSLSSIESQISTRVGRLSVASESLSLLSIYYGNRLKPITSRISLSGTGVARPLASRLFDHRSRGRRELQAACPSATVARRHRPRRREQAGHARPSTARSWSNMRDTRCEGSTLAPRSTCHGAVIDNAGAVIDNADAVIERDAVRPNLGRTCPHTGHDRTAAPRVASNRRASARSPRAKLQAHPGQARPPRSGPQQHPELRSQQSWAVTYSSAAAPRARAGDRSHAGPAGRTALRTPSPCQRASRAAVPAGRSRTRLRR